MGSIARCEVRGELHKLAQLLLIFLWGKVRGIPLLSHELLIIHCYDLEAQQFLIFIHYPISLPALTHYFSPSENHPWILFF